MFLAIYKCIFLQKNPNASIDDLNLPNVPGQPSYQPGAFNYPTPNQQADPLPGKINNQQVCFF